MDAPTRPRAAIHHGVFALYFAGAVAMAVFAARPDLALAGDSDATVRTMRGVFGIVAILGAAIAAGGFRRWRPTRTLAVALHGLVTLIALAGLGSLLAGAPLFGGQLLELLAKAGVHALLTWLWLSRWMRAWFGH